MRSDGRPGVTPGTVIAFIVPPRALKRSGTLPTHQPLFVVLLASIVVVVGALTFIPALALGPIVEHLQMISG